MRLKKEPHADAEDRDEYTGENVFWVPPDARWPYLQKNAKQPTIGVLIDQAMTRHQSRVNFELQEHDDQGATPAESLDKTPLWAS